MANVRTPKPGETLARLDLPVFPAVATLKGEIQPEQLAGLALKPSGFVLDYELLYTDTNDFTFQGDTTYYVQDSVNLSGTTVIEGGTVVKVTNSSTLNLRFQGPIECRTGPYRPAVFTAKDDDSVGDKLSDSTGTPDGYYGRTHFFLSYSGAPFELHDLRSRFAVYPFSIYAGSSLTLRHAQIAYCDAAFRTYASFSLANVLLHDANTAFFFYFPKTNTSEHVTFHRVADLMDYLGGTPGTIKLTNSLLIAVTNDLTYVGSNVETKLDDTGIFQTVGAASHYLADSSPYRDAGTTNIQADLLADLAEMTTYPPGEVFSNATLSANRVLAPTAARDDAQPDLGYHYDPLDLVFGGAVLTNANLTILAGTVLGAFALSNSGSSLQLLGGASLFSEGTALQPVRFVRYNTVQEQANTNWIGIGGYTLLTARQPAGAGPRARFRFTHWSTPARDAYHFYGWTLSNGWPVPFTDCEFAGGYVAAEMAGVTFTNCLFDRVYTWAADADYTNGFDLRFRNNTIRGGLLDLYKFYGGTWELKDNLLDGVSVVQVATLDHGYNGYVTNAAGQWLTPSSSNDVFLASLDYQTGPLGVYYLPTNCGLLNTGSVANAASVGLYHYTTTTNQSPETNSVVDLGYHYVATDSLWQQLADTDGGGVPDYFEDANGDGTGTNDLTDWTVASDDSKGILSPRYLRCEYLQNPLAIDAAVVEDGESVQRPRLFWIVESEGRAQWQLAYRILCASDTNKLAQNIGDLWDTGKFYSDDTIQVEYDGAALTNSGQRVYWKVRVWDKHDIASDWSTNAFWQMGILTNWADAKWIRVENVPTSFPVSPMLRTTFLLSNDVKRATVYASAKGVYELWINGERIGKNILAPEWTDYNKRIQYQAFDVTTNLFSGEAPLSNVVGAVLGKGWCFGSIANNAYSSLGNGPQFLLRLDIVTATTNLSIVSGNHWMAFTNGPIRYSDIWYGETYDARNEANIANWATTNYTGAASFFTNYTQALDVDASELVPQPNEPIQVMQQITPIARWTNTNASGQYVNIFDFGQNMVGWTHLRIQGAANQQVRVRHAELLQLDGSYQFVTNGNIDTVSARFLDQADTYTLSDTSEHQLEPRFTYHGFRYAEVSVSPGTVLPLNAITGIVLHSSLSYVGQTICSHADVNRLMTNIFWSQRGNMFGIPTDCPQRPERLGWMGDIQVFANTACFNMDMAAFLTKFIRDIRDEQETSGNNIGRYPDYAPFTGTFGPQWADPGWADAGVILPYRLYQNYGDVRMLREHFESMTNWIAFAKASNPTLVWTLASYWDLLDWLNGDTFQTYPSGWSGGNRAAVPKAVFGTAFFAHSTDLVAKSAHVLWAEAVQAGDSMAAAQYWTAYTNHIELAAAIRDTFYTNGTTLQTNVDGSLSNIGNGTQGDYALALNFDLLREDHRATAVERLLNAAEKGINNYNGAYATNYTNHLSTGMQLTGRAMLELTRWGHADSAFDLLLNPQFSSWMYMSQTGCATTVWESWNNYIIGTPTGNYGHKSDFLNSWNHYALGSVGEWIYINIGGINGDDNLPGFKAVNIHPRVGGGITSSSSWYDSIRGPLFISWATNASTTNFTLSVTLPPNTTGSIYIPGTDFSKIIENGLPATNSPGVLKIGIANGLARFVLGSGKYSFSLIP